MANDLVIWGSSYLGIGLCFFIAFLFIAEKEHRTFSKGYLSIADLAIGFLVLSVCLYAWPTIIIGILAVKLDSKRKPLIKWKKPKHKVGDLFQHKKTKTTYTIDEVEKDKTLSYIYCFVSSSNAIHWVDEEDVLKYYKPVPKGKLSEAIFA